MRAAVIHGPGDIRVESVPGPEISEPNDVLLRVDRAAICGSDLYLYSGRMGIEPGVVIGHEYMGTVEAVGPGVTGIEPGDRVVGSFMVSCGRCAMCRRVGFAQCLMARFFGFGFAFGDLPGSHAERMRIPEADHTLRKIPQGTGHADEDFLLLGDAFTSAYDALHLADMRPGDSVVVLGAGPVGLHSIQVARALGAGRIVCVDRVPERLKLAGEMGAVVVDLALDLAEDVVLEHTGWRGADVVVEATGDVQAIRSAVPLVRNGGSISITSIYTDEDVPLPIGEMWLKHVKLVMGIANIQGRIDEAMDLMTGGDLRPSVVVSDVMGLSEAPEAFRKFAQAEATKIVLDPTR